MIADIHIPIDSNFNLRPQSLFVPPQTIGLPATPAEREARRNAAAVGSEFLKAGKIGVLLVAGGSGTRLGFPQPKGMFPIGPVSDRSFFHIFAGQVLALSKRHGLSIPLLVMTAEQTHQEITHFFNAHNWFGLDPLDVFLFPQGTHLVLDAESGRCLLDEFGTNITSADGHGGAIAALENAGLFAEMKWRGVETLFYHQVDNPMVHMCDPVFIGFHAQHGAEVSTKVVRKKSPGEKVGIVAEVDGQLRVIEYSELPPAIAAELGPTGDLLFNAANTAIHLFQLDFLEGISADPAGLPWHRVERRVPYIGGDGNISARGYVDAIKLERFIFDVLPKAQKTVVLEIERTLEFAPLKNAEGDCSPTAVRKSMSDAARARLRDAGVLLPEDAMIEIGSSILPDESLLPHWHQAPLSHRSLIISRDHSVENLSDTSPTSI